jgi:hypothetical protein
MNRTETRPETRAATIDPSQANMLRQIGFHGALVMFTVLLISGVLKAF